jgi:5'-nucleotidase
MDKKKAQILLVNDDGIESPGLWAAAGALSELGYVTVVAPRDQYSGAGRSLSMSADGRIHTSKLQVGGQEWTVYDVGGSPAQVVLHSVLEIMPEKPDLVVSGINYGENPGTSITVSGTVGAAMEGAALGIPSLAVSLQLLDTSDYVGYSRKIDFSTAAYFTCYFAGLMLNKQLADEVDLLKIEVPAMATPDTAWRITCLANHRYYIPIIRREGSWDDPAVIDARLEIPTDLPHDTDAYTLYYDHMVAVTPLTLDMTARVDLGEFEKKLRKN